MQVGRITAPVKRAGQFINKTGKAAVAAVAIGAAALGANANTNTAQQVTAPTQATLKAVGGVGGFTPWIYTDEVGMSNKTVRVENDKLEYVFHTNIPASHLKVLGSKTLEAETRDFQQTGTIVNSKTSHTDPKYGPVYEYKVEYPVGYHFGMINANNVATNCVDGSKGIVTHIPEFKKQELK